MSHYENIAVLGVRLVGFNLFTLGLVGSMYVLAIALPMLSMTGENYDRLLSSLAYLAAGAIVYLLSKPFGRRLGKGL